MALKLTGTLHQQFLFDNDIFIEWTKSTTIRTLWNVMQYLQQYSPRMVIEVCVAAVRLAEQEVLGRREQLSLVCSLQEEELVL
jgi:hypothetical protein